MAQAFGQVRQKGEELSEEEIAQLELGSIPTLARGSDGTVELTQAELALMEANGAIIKEIHTPSPYSLTKENPFASAPGEVLFQFGKGNNQFTGIVRDVSDNSEKVWLWHPITGQKRLQSRNQIVYLCHKGWLPRAPVNVHVAPRELRCPSSWNPHPLVRFSTPQDQEKHFEGRHRTEWQQLERAKAQRRQDTLDRVLEKIAAGDTGSGSELAAAMALLAEQLQATNATLSAPAPEQTPEPVGAGKRRA